MSWVARFAAAGHELYLVGGSVRDALLGRLGDDLDFTTDARPEQSQELAKRLGRLARGTSGIAFGTVGAAEGRPAARDHHLPQRGLRPDVAASPRCRVRRHRSRATCVRRDFTVNAMAVLGAASTSSSTRSAGCADLAAAVLRTPGTPEDSFGDDPLRMLRAARFAAQLGFAVAPDGARRRCARWPSGWRSSPPSGSRPSCPSCCSAPDPRRGLGLLVGHRARRASSCRSCRRCAWRSTSTTSTRTSTSTRSPCCEQAMALEPDGPGPRPAAGRAAARHRQAATRKFEAGGRRHASTTTRSSAPR